jgi:hypothetical protein
MALQAKWQFMDRSVTHKIVYGPQLRFGPYNNNIVWATSRSINCHMALSAMNYLINTVSELFGLHPMLKFSHIIINCDLRVSMLVFDDFHFCPFYLVFEIHNMLM